MRAAPRAPVTLNDAGRGVALQRRWATQPCEGAC